MAPIFAALIFTATGAQPVADAIPLAADPLSAPAPAPAAAEPTPPATQPTAAPAPEPPPRTAAPAEAAGPPPDTQPVVRAGPGNWGMTFIFGGLAPLSIGGLGDLPLSNGLMFTEIGVRRVFKRVVIPFSFGAGVAHTKQTGQSPNYGAGVSASVAVLKGFRVWRRIAPYFGAFLHTHYVDARGPDNWLFNVSVGPILGIEYYLADRVSLYGQGIFAIGPDITKGRVDFLARAAMAAGGQLGLTFYF